MGFPAARDAGVLAPVMGGLGPFGGSANWKLSIGKSQIIAVVSFHSIRFPEPMPQIKALCLRIILMAP